MPDFVGMLLSGMCVIASQGGEFLDFAVKFLFHAEQEFHFDTDAVYVRPDIVWQGVGIEAYAVLFSDDDCTLAGCQLLEFPAYVGYVVAGEVVVVGVCYMIDVGGECFQMVAEMLRLCYSGDNQDVVSGEGRNVIACERTWRQVFECGEI